MLAQIISVGSELVEGKLIDTNSPYIASMLHEIGIDVARITAVGDDIEALSKTLKEALESSDIVILTGGLGQLIISQAKPSYSV